MSLPFRHVPDADALVFRVTEDEFLARVKQDAGDIVVMPSTRVHLPGLGV